MAGTSSAQAETRTVGLRSVPAVVPSEEEEKQQLAADLTKMGCQGLLAEPWAMKSETLVKEFLSPRSNEWEGTLRRLPELWTADRWAEVYSFRKEGRLKAQRTNTWINGKFDSSINPKDGYAVSDCVDPREQRVLEFVVPILYPEKPSRVTKEIGNTIFGALAGEYQVNWGLLIQEVVGHLVSNLEKKKASPISPYLFHLYYRNECLREEEMKEVEVARECLEYGIGPDMPPDDEDLGSESVGSEERRKLSPNTRMKHTQRSSRGKSPVRTPEMSALDLDDEPFLRLQEELDRASNRYAVMEAVVKKTSQLLGDCKVGNVVKELKKLKEKDTEALEAENRRLQQKVDDLKVELALKDEDLQKFKTLKIEAILEIREIMGHPSDILNKARLFSEYLNKSLAPTLPKVIAILHGYQKKMEAVLGEVRNLVSGTVGESSQSLLPTQKETPLKERLLGDLKTLPAQRPGKEPSVGTSEGVPRAESSPAPLPPWSPPRPTEVSTPTLAEVPNPTPPEVPTPTVVPVPKPQVTPEVGATSKTLITPSPRKMSLRRPQIPTPEVHELENTTEETGSTGESEEDEEASSPRQEREMRSSGKKKSKPIYNSSQVSKRTKKTLVKGEPSNKRPRAK